MTLGEKLRTARLEAGLSQRQLCGDLITRNMLSQIENGAASPSMATLTALASRLGKPVGWFLGEETRSGNSAIMARAREHYDQGKYRETLEALKDYQEPDGDFDRECALLQALTLLALGEEALEQGRTGLAREYLNRAEPWLASGYCREALTIRRLLLLARLGEPVGANLPDVDEVLLFKAEEALKGKDPARAQTLLAAAETREPRWQLLRGRCCLASQDWQGAAQALSQAEEAFPEETVPLLEEAYRQMGDYRRAYEYACRQKKS